MAKKNDKLHHIELAYDFLSERVGKNFTIKEFATAADWKLSSVTTTISKKLSGLVSTVDTGIYSVLPDFLTLTKREFTDLLGQSRRLFSDYDRSAYDSVVVFEFLLPLTQQDHLRTALDTLFYEDTLRARIAVIGLPALAPIVPRLQGETDAAYTTRIVQLIGSLFGGYSIGHVAGRFRAAPLTTRENAWNHRYLVDEATAVVRFICLLKSTKMEVPVTIFAPVSPAQCVATAAEAGMVRGLFFAVFVEAIIKRIPNEDEIWLLESGVESHLYVWSRKES
jgi:hypothetical protein